MVHTNIETRPDAVIGAGTLGGRIALMFATQNRVPRAAFRLTA
jgi:3-hydroxyacyl-CoA dehydrogenase